MSAEPGQDSERPSAEWPALFRSPSLVASYFSRLIPELCVELADAREPFGQLGKAAASEVDTPEAWQDARGRISDTHELLEYIIKVCDEKVASLNDVASRRVAEAPHE
jgi:hypothetical protein